MPFDYVYKNAADDDQDVNKETKLNLGCGALSVYPDSFEPRLAEWINIDGDIRLWLMSRRIIDWAAKVFFRSRYKDLIKPPPNFRWIDLSKGRLPFKTASVNYCYSSHFIEHIDRWKNLQLMKEVNRILKPDGLIRIVVPDLEKIVKEYMEAKQGKSTENFKLMSNPAERFNGFYSKKPSSTHFRSRRRIIRFIQTAFSPNLPHQWLYDFDDISRLLEDAGFQHIAKRSFHVGRITDLNEFDLEAHKFESMYVEALKE